jgi:hypothetical protein
VVPVIRPLIAALCLSACAAPELATRRIGNDGGGVVTEYIARADSLRGQPVVISGECHSACAVLASLPSACLGPRARVGLHPPYFVAGGVAFPHYGAEFFAHVTPQIAQAVRAMPFDYSRAGHIQLTITAATAAQYGLRAC